MTNENDWLKELKVGDEVIRWRRGIEIILPIKRATATVIYLDFGERFRRLDGKSKMSPAKHHPLIFEATSERVEAFQIRNLLWRIRNDLGTGAPKRFTYDQLQRIAAVINEAKEN